MGKVRCIILNYSDASITMNLVDEIREYNCLDSIAVVDNCSTDGSRKQFKAPRDPDKVHVLCTEENGGYGSRNQAGIDYAAIYLETGYVIITNPDIHVRVCYIEWVKLVLDGMPEAVMVPIRVASPEGGDLSSYWTLLPMWKDLLDTGLIIRRLFKPMLNTPAYRLKEDGDESCRLIDVAPGPFFMLKPGLLIPQGIKELFDRYMFLYYEEKALGQKFKEMGLKTLLVTDVSYAHAHSATIDKSVKQIVDKQKLLYESKRYYYRECLHGTPAQMAAVRVPLGLVLAGVWFLTVVCRMRWQRGREEMLHELTERERREDPGNKIFHAFL